jgi:hypothetical protein
MRIVERREQFLELPPRLAILFAPEPHGDPANTLDGRTRGVARLLRDGLAEHVAEEPHVLAQAVVLAAVAHGVASDARTVPRPHARSHATSHVRSAFTPRRFGIPLLY